MTTARRLRSAFLALLLLASQGTGRAAEAPAPRPEGDEVFGIESPLGRIDYRAGRGLHVGYTGLTIGGFATAFAERLEDGDSSGGIDHVNFLISYDPFSFLHLFTEIEVNDILKWETGKRGARSDPGTKVERLYADLGWTDAANVRVGKFLTPFGRWNQVLAEPLLWTTSEPLIVEEVFDETQSGGMLFGTFFPRDTALSYMFYGTFLDHIAPERDAPPAKYSLGGRLEWTSRGGASIGASYVAAARSRGQWNHLGGLDALWRPHERVELSGELLFGEGSHEEGGQWGLYAQAVVETFPTLYLIGRYDRYDLPASKRGIDLFTIGAAWVPRYYLRLKVDYRIADHLDDLSEPGLQASFSVLF